MGAMGFLSWLGFDRTDSLINVAAPASTSYAGVASPWAGESHLARVTLDDLFDVKVRPVTRAEAMSVPAVAKARHLLCEMPARQPLVAYKDGAPLPVQPRWLSSTNSQVAPRTRIIWLLDDLLFHGWSLLAIERGADGAVLDAVRVPPERWQFNNDGVVEVADANGSFRAADNDAVVLIPGPSEGLLTTAARTIRAFRNLEDAWMSRVAVPLPTTEIRYTGDEDLTTDEMVDIRDTFIRARQDVNGAVMVTPKGFEIHTHAQDGFDLFETGRNAATLDIARYTNLPAAILDASNVNSSSVNYANSAVKRNEFHDISIRSSVMTLEDRLSMDDVTPRGTYLQFDLSNLIETPDSGIGPTLND